MSEGAKEGGMEGGREGEGVNEFKSSTFVEI